MLGKSISLLGFQKLEPTVLSWRFYWDLGQNLSVEDGKIVFLAADYSDNLTDTWIHSHIDERFPKFELVLNFDDGILHFDCNNVIHPLHIYFRTDRSYIFKADFGRACDISMLSENLYNWHLRNEPVFPMSLQPVWWRIWGCFWSSLGRPFRETFRP